MKRFLDRAAALLLALALGIVCIAGCHSEPKDDSGNSAMTEKQKAVIAEHKQKQDQ